MPQCHGTKQGDLLSPILFVIALQFALEHCDVSHGLRVRSDGLGEEGGERTDILTYLLYADDVLSTTGEYGGAKEQLRDLSAALAKFGLRINFSKTKCMVINAPSDAPWGSDEGEQSEIEQIERVNAFTYLGSYFSDGSNSDSIEKKHGIAGAPAEHRIRLANLRYWRMSMLSPEP